MEATDPPFSRRQRLCRPPGFLKFRVLIPPLFAFFPDHKLLSVVSRCLKLSKPSRLTPSAAPGFAARSPIPWCQRLSRIASHPSRSEHCVKRQTQLHCPFPEFSKKRFFRLRFLGSPFCL